MPLALSRSYTLSEKTIRYLDLRCGVRDSIEHKNEDDIDNLRVPTVGVT